MEGFYNQDLRKEASQGEMYDKLDRTQDPVQSGKVNDAGDASDMNAE